MTNNELQIVINSLSNARIIIGANFEKLANEKKYTEALLFQATRDSLANIIQVLMDYSSTKGEQEWNL